MLHFSTKAGNLAQLYSLQTQNKLKHTRVLPLLTTTLNTLQNPESKNALLDSITTTFATFQCQKLIIRSSSQAEDSTKSSNAGAYESIANVDSNDKKAARLNIARDLLSKIDYEGKDPSSVCLLADPAILHPYSQAPH